MSLPSFTPFPAAQVRNAIPSDEWQLCLESWTSLAGAYLRLSDDEFSSALSATDSISPFLISFFNASVVDHQLLKTTIGLRKKSFFLLHRIYSNPHIPHGLMVWPALSDISHAFLKSIQFRTLLQNLWSAQNETIEKSLQAAKTSLTKNLESSRPEEAESTMDRLAPLLKVSSDANLYIFTGTDLADALYSAYPRVAPRMQKKLVHMAYMGLMAISDGSKSNHSLLSDHLYNYKTTEEREQKNEPGKKTLVADLVTNTPLLQRIRERASASESTRVKNIAASLVVFRQSSVARPKRLVRRTINKGKGRAKEEAGEHGEIHVHRMSKISQIQDLFPDLGAGFISKLLDEYDENIEQITAHLLDNSLPPHLVDAHRGKQLSTSETTVLESPAQSIQTWERRNVFDGDEFDRLDFDPSRLHIGRRDPGLTADKMLFDGSKALPKSSILAALAALDLDDDERDDTYDSQDVGASIDNTAADSDMREADLSDRHEEILFGAYSTQPEVFERDSKTRQSPARIALRNELNMTNEAIEGWAIMLRRNPKHFKHLASHHSTFSGQQQELESTSWRDGPATSDDEGDGSEQREHNARGGFSARGRGRGRGKGRGTGKEGGRGGGNVAGSANNENDTTKRARDKKDVNKASRANHNRKIARGKKMARAGFPS